MENEATTIIRDDTSTVSGIRIGRKDDSLMEKNEKLSHIISNLRKPGFVSKAKESQEEDENTVALQLIDFYWLTQSQVDKRLPLFPGFCSQFIHDHLPQQRIWYMDPISAPPTRNDVVRETMKRSMNVANETGQEYGVVTYDLAVALKAYSIQALDSPLFDKLLIMLGNFHLEMAFYGAIGTFINESGAEYLLTESGILAEGSLMGFIRGKYYNRCPRIHAILALVMERKLYESFLSTLDSERRDALDDFFAHVPQDRNMQTHYLESSLIFRQHMQEYDMYFTGAMNGALGPTAQYWTMYVYMVNRVHRNLMCAVRTNDVDGYINILPAIIDIFFGLNRPNYARWVFCFSSNWRWQTQEVGKCSGLVPFHSDAREKGFHDPR